MLDKDLIQHCAEFQGWHVYTNKDGMEFQKHSPAGEDFIFSAGGESPREVIEDIISYADDFDPKEHAEYWVRARQYGRFTDIPSIRVLIEDADAIKAMLGRLSEAVKELRDEYHG